MVSSISKGATHESITETLTVLSDFGILRSGAGLGVARNSEDDMIGSEFRNSLEDRIGDRMSELRYLVTVISILEIKISEYV